MRLNQVVNDCAEILRELERNEAEIVVRQLISMFGYNTSPYPAEPNIECPECRFQFTGDETWDGDEGRGTDCPCCGSEVIMETES